MATDWLDRLNREETAYEAAGARADMLHWAYQSELPDNAPHRHTYFEVCQVGRHGAGLFHVEGRTIPLRPGTLFVARPGVMHQITNTARPCMELYWVSYQLSPAGPRPGTPGAWAATAAGPGTSPAGGFAGWGGSSGGARTLPAVLRAFAESPLAAVPDRGGRVGAAWRAVRALAPAAGPETLRHAVVALVLAVAEAFAPGPGPEGRAAELGGAAGRRPAGTHAPGSGGGGAGRRPVNRTGAGRGTGARTGQVARGAAGGPRRAGPVPPAVRVALRHIHDNVDGDLSSEEIARQAGVSARHLSRLMREHAGTTVAAYVLCARLQVACHLLRRSALPVKDVAARAGYPEVHHFTRMFTRHMGCPPAAYRRGDGPANGPLVRNGQMPGRLV